MLDTLELIACFDSFEAHGRRGGEEVIMDTGLFIHDLLFDPVFENVVVVVLFHGTGGRICIAELYFVLVDGETIRIIRFFKVE